MPQIVLGNLTGFYKTDKMNGEILSYLIKTTLQALGLKLKTREINDTIELPRYMVHILE